MDRHRRELAVAVCKEEARQLVRQLLIIGTCVAPWIIAAIAVAIFT